MSTCHDNYHDYDSFGDKSKRHKKTTNEQKSIQNQTF